MENKTLNKTYLGPHLCSSDNSYPHSFHQNNQTILEANNTDLLVSLAYVRIIDHVNIACYLIIFVFGIIGNSLVIYVILMYANMKTVANMYILNLALSDIMFLTMQPITVTTVILKHWIFGLVLCKIHFVLCAINIFGGAFNLCVMSADRFLAVCYPIQSIGYRTPRIALCLCLGVWVFCFLVMLPVIIFATTTKHHTFPGKVSCRLNWPDNHLATGAVAFTWYSFIFGFVIPVLLMCIFYTLVIIRLRKVAAVKKSNATGRSHGRVTRLIFTVVTVYVLCWTPYWCFQVYGVINQPRSVDIRQIIIANGFTILSYVSSMLNPLLYAFMSENFRQSFTKAFKCGSFFKKNPLDCNERSDYPTTSQTFMRGMTTGDVEERMELSDMGNNSNAAHEPKGHNSIVVNTRDVQEYLKTPTKL